MITIKNARTLDGKSQDIQIFSLNDLTVDAHGWFIFPGIIDSHITLGSPHSKNWIFSIESLVRGGITTVLDIPSPDFPSESPDDIKKKRESLDYHLLELNIPLRYLFYSKGNSPYIDVMGLEKKLIVGSSIILDKDETLEEKVWDQIFQMAAWENLPVIFNSIYEKPQQNEAVITALLEKAIYYAERQNARLFVLNISTKDELDLIKQARERELLIYAETTPRYLFQKTSHADYLWEAINNGSIDVIGSGYNNDKPDREQIIYDGLTFSFSNPIFLLPLMLTAYDEGRTTLENIVRLMSVNLYEIFSLERKNDDIVLVNLEENHMVQRISNGNSMTMNLKGWPVMTIVNGEGFTSLKGTSHLTHVE